MAYLSGTCHYVIDGMWATSGGNYSRENAIKIVVCIDSLVVAGVAVAVVVLRVLPVEAAPERRQPLLALISHTDEKEPIGVAVVPTRPGRSRAGAVRV
jgi:hypothetical protein